MQEDINNELENLYKKAAEHFPLNTHSADWQSVLVQLEEDDSKKTPIWFNSKKNYLALLFILFAVVSILIGVNYFNKNKQILQNEIASKKQTQQELEAIKLQNKNIEQTITNAVYKRIIDSLNSQKESAKTNKLIVREYNAHKEYPSLQKQNIQSAIANV